MWSGSETLLHCMLQQLQPTILPLVLLLNAPSEFLVLGACDGVVHVLPTFLRDNAIIFVLYAAPVLDVDVVGIHNVVLSGLLPYRKCKNSCYFCRLVEDFVQSVLNPDGHRRQRGPRQRKLRAHLPHDISGYAGVVPHVKTEPDVQHHTCQQL